MMMHLNRYSTLLLMTIVVFFMSACVATNQQQTAENTESQAISFPSIDGPWGSVNPEDEGWDTQALEELFEFARSHNSSGLVILKNGRILAERQWTLENPPVAQTVGYRDIWYHGDSPDGWAREDVASTQKSVIAILAGIARDKGLLDFDAPPGEPGTGIGHHGASLAVDDFRHFRKTGIRISRRWRLVLYQQGLFPG
jgi:CubicO group peptidase (beta-lactamase class C family)